LISQFWLAGVSISATRLFKCWRSLRNIRRNARPTSIRELLADCETVSSLNRIELSPPPKSIPLY